MVGGLNIHSRGRDVGSVVVTVEFLRIQKGARPRWEVAMLSGVDESDARQHAIEHYGWSPKIRLADSKVLIWDRRSGGPVNPLAAQGDPMPRAKPQEPAAPAKPDVDYEAIAAQIIELGRLAERLKKTLSQRAIVVLIQDATKLPRGVIEQVLDALPELPTWCLPKKGKPA